MARKIEIEIVGDTKSLDRALSRTTKTTQSSFQKISKAAGIAGLAIGGGLAIAAKIGFDELAEGQKVAAQTAAVLKSTGGAANVTAKEVDGLAMSLSQMSGVDDELIAASENLLLTFRNVRNEAGKGNDIFDQSTKAILDMSVAMGTDLQGATLQVGKALQDPIRGLTALRRVGVTFTKAQEGQIKKMVKAGDVMGAQKLILAELTKEFGGSAKAAGETLPGQLSKARNAFEEMAGQLMVALLPALTSLATTLSKVAGFLSRHTTLAKALVIGFAGLAAGLMALSVATKVAAAAQVLLNIALIANPIGAVVVAVVALGVALVVAYKKSETFRAVVSGAIDFVRAHWQTLLLAFGLLPFVIVKIVRNFDTFKSAAVRAFGFAAAAARSLASAVERVVSWVSTLIGWIRTALGYINRLSSAIQAIPRPSLPDLTPGFSVPGFATGGVVPGPMGVPRLAVVHGGERVLPVGRARTNGGGGTINVYLTNRGVIGSEREAVTFMNAALENWKRSAGGQIPPGFRG